jgi:hypothetical protein
MRNPKIRNLDFECEVYEDEYEAAETHLSEQELHTLMNRGELDSLDVITRLFGDDGLPY